MGNQVSSLAVKMNQEKQYFVTPTQRWITTSINIPYQGPVSRNNSNSPIAVSSRAGEYLNWECFAFWCDPSGRRVDTKEEAEVVIIPPPVVEEQPLEKYFPSPSSVDGEASGSASMLQEPLLEQKSNPIEIPENIDPVEQSVDSLDDSKSTSIESGATPTTNEVPLKTSTVGSGAKEVTSKKK